MHTSLYSLFFLLLFSITTLSAQNTDRSIAILNLSDRNSESNDARLLSVKHMIDVVGIPYVVTEDLDEARDYAMIFCSSLINSSTFNSDEETILKNYVSDGGTLFAPRIENEDLFALFGIEGYEASKTRYEITWNWTSASPALRWIDEAEERTISLGRSTSGEIYKTLGYQLAGAQPLAFFADGTAAITRNIYGFGQAVSIGVSWKEVVLRNQINRDYEAQRITSNGFEPTMDALMLFVRALYAEHHPYTVWKNTSPGNSAATLMITHDVDSQTGMDSLHFFVDYERDQNIEATYNVTYRYFDDALMSDFYNNQQSEMEYILANGHQIQSHSVGHFFDFAEDDVFPMGAVGNTKANYTPHNDGQVTTGATVFGECEVSKSGLEQDLGISVRTFRAGHLAYPRYLVDVLEALGYEYNSTHSACDVLTNFPYQNVKGRSFSKGISSIYEIPVTISDVFHSNPISRLNYLYKAVTWLEVTRKNMANNAPTVLLIHPNRQYKLEGLKYYLEELANEPIHIMEMGRFGDFWKARTAFVYDSELTGEQLTITIPSAQSLEDNISFIVNNGQDLSEIIVQNEENETLDFIQENWEDNDVILYYQGVLNSTTPELIDPASLTVFPNPAKTIFNIEFEMEKTAKIQFHLYDINGQQAIPAIRKEAHQGENRWSINVAEQQIAPGIYFMVLQSEAGGFWRRKVVLM